MKIYVTSKQDIFCLAQSRSDIAALLEENTREIMMHLIKLYMFPDAQEVNHWKKEVFNLLHRVPRFKSSKKFPSSDFIFNNTFKINQDCIDTLFEYVLEDYIDTHDVANRSFEDLKLQVWDYYSWVSEVLSNSGEVNRTRVYNKLDELGFGRLD